MWQHGWAVCTAHKELCHIGSNIVLSSALLSFVCSALSLSQRAGKWFNLAINHDPSHYWRGNTMWGGGGRQKRRRTGNCGTRSVFERFVFWYCRSETQLDARGSGGNEKELVVDCCHLRFLGRLEAFCWWKHFPSSKRHRAAGASCA